MKPRDPGFRRYFVKADRAVVTFRCDVLAEFQFPGLAAVPYVNRVSPDFPDPERKGPVEQRSRRTLADYESAFFAACCGWSCSEERDGKECGAEVCSGCADWDHWTVMVTRA